MINLFAGVGPGGEMRFIGEVPRGAACNCRCPECNSPLIAKQGSEKEWHFAHEAGQERPECAAGALNMLRRLSSEYLRAQEPLLLPMYRERAQVKAWVGLRFEDVEWPAKLLGLLQWSPKGPRHAPIARGRLDTGVDVELFVEIEDHSMVTWPAKPDLAEITFSCRLPSASEMRSRTLAEQHLQRNGRLVWRNHPDSLGLVAAARVRVAARAEHEGNTRRAQQLLRTEQAGLRWGVIKARLDQPFERFDPAVDQANRTRHPSAAEPEPESIVDVYAWAPERKPGSSFIFYRLTDGSAWVVYTMVDETLAIAPWPKEDGWDEALPPSVGAADQALGVYRGKGQIAVMTFFGPRATRTIGSTDPKDFAGH